MHPTPRPRQSTSAGVVAAIENGTVVDGCPLPCWPRWSRALRDLAVGRRSVHRRWQVCSKSARPTPSDHVDCMLSQSPTPSVKLLRPPLPRRNGWPTWMARRPPPAHLELPETRHCFERCRRAPASAARLSLRHSLLKAAPDELAQGPRSPCPAATEDTLVGVVGVVTPDANGQLIEHGHLVGREVDDDGVGGMRLASPCVDGALRRPTSEVAGSLSRRLVDFS